MPSSSSSSDATTATSPLKTPTVLQSTVLGGSAAVFAVNFTHPIELVKSRVQTSSNGVVATCTNTFQREGLAAFWKGLPWAYCREGSYTAIRYVRRCCRCSLFDGACCCCCCCWAAGDATEDDTVVVVVVVAVVFHESQPCPSQNTIPMLFRLHTCD